MKGPLCCGCFRPVPPVFAPSNFTLESLLTFTEQFDYGIFVLAADDFVKMRGEKPRASRDNVIFEAGLFLGALGRTNCFLLVSKAKNFRLQISRD